MPDTKELDEVIIGRVEPHIYAFSTNTIPNYLKIGDTYRPVNVRLDEWREFFPTLEKKFENSAKINDDIYFRDFSVHQFVENEKKRVRLQPRDVNSEIYYSKEFFKDATVEDIVEALDDIKNDFENKTQKYQFYNAVNRLAETITFVRNESYPPRPNQKDTIDKFKKAVANGRNNLLMYAVMRFGKSFTSMCCAVEIEAKLVVIVSAKADVKMEWKKTVESHVKFKEYDFLTSDDLKTNSNAIKDRLNNNKRVAIFLTLQDLQGETIKDKHKDLFGEQIDLLLVDETHFGARAEKYGQVIKATNYEKDVKNNKDNEDFIDIQEAEEQIKVLNAKIRLHLSGTPYRILMGSEFKKEDIIAFYQFADIVKDQMKWIVDNNKKPENEQQEDWDNPYYGFPQMVRFAFNPNESSRKRLQELRKNGVSYAFSALLKPKSIKKSNNGDNKEFIFEKEVLDLLEVIDGSKTDNELLNFLDYDKIKEGKMCRHIVMVLPYCASCDAMEDLIKKNKEKFKNLNSYEIINISGVENPNNYKTTFAVKKAITDFENQGKKTITLTVNRMLTGSTVQEWDTMLYLKDTSSPQEYDQAIFRLQNQYIKTYKSDDGKKIMYNMKPQTLLVDFMPNRMFIMQEQKAQIYNVNIDDGGNNKLKQRIEEELRISPIITINSNKIKEVKATDILEVVSNYKMDKGIKDEALEIPVDLAILDIPEIKAIIEKENEIGSKSGLSTPAHSTEDGEDDIETPPATNGNDDNQNTSNDRQNLSQSDEQKLQNSLKKKVQSYYARILLFAFITSDVVSSLKEIIDVIDSENNKRIIRNLGLQKTTLSSFYNFYFNHNKWVLRDLDYKIQDLNNLSHKDELKPEEKATVAVNKFGKLGDAVVITPSNICDDMINLFPNKIFENGKHILDIAGVSGEFATAIVKRMTILGVDNSVIRDYIYTIPKTSICYELTRKVYEMLDLNVDNIAAIYAEDLLKIKSNNNIDYYKICNILTQNKKFSEIKLTDTVTEGGQKMKFDAIVGNPPYQENIGSITNGNESLGKQLFPAFIKLVIILSNRYASLITPARWFTGDAQDKSFVKLRAFIKEHNNFSKIIYYKNGKSIFNDVEIKGGVQYFLNDKLQKGKTSFITVDGDKYEEVKRDLFYDNYDIIISDKNAFPILSNIRKNAFVSLTTITTGRNPFGIIGKKEIVEGISSSEYKKGLFELRCKDDTIRWIKEDSIRKNKELFNNYKVFISKSAGNPNGDKKVIGMPYVGKRKSACTDSLFTIGSFDNNIEAENLAKYLKSKFVRYLVSILKSSQNVTQIVYEFVPLQDFKDKSDIDWAKSVAEIDKQLYKKYNLTQEEIDFIEKTIKPME